MANIDITWEIDGGQITAEESVRALVNVIQSKTIEHTGTFWTWQNEVSLRNVFHSCVSPLTLLVGIPMVIETGGKAGQCSLGTTKSV